MSVADDVEPIAEVVDWLGGAPQNQDGSFYLAVSRLLPYKNVDAIVRSFAGGNVGWSSSVAAPRPSGCAR